jgi:hypothetical protein
LTQAEKARYRQIVESANQQGIDPLALPANTLERHWNLARRWLYPVGYNVQCLPKLDKVWPS